MEKETILNLKRSVIDHTSVLKRMLSFFVGIISCFSVLYGQNAYVFENVNVIPMTDENKVLEENTVVIEKGRITAMGQIKAKKYPKGAVIINGDGHFLIPGLAEMHAHIPGNENNEETVKQTLFLYLSNGITTIRGMLGQSYHLELREKVIKGDILGPRIFTSGPSLNGNTVKTPEEARTKVMAQKKAGYDFLKLHPGIKLEVFNELVETAKSADIPFAGHVSVHVGIRNALEAQYASIDHVDGYLEGLVPIEENVDPTANGFFGFNFTDKVDMSLLPELVEMTRKNGVWVVPTQSLLERWVGATSPDELASQKEMQYIPKSTLENWVERKRNFINAASYNPDRAKKFNEIRRTIILALHEGGVGLLLGSDAPQVFNVPGFSIQHEFDEMVKSGLSNYDAIKTGTVNPSVFFNADNQFGTIEVGKSADLILLRDNPLDNITALSENAGVMVRGQWLPEDFIEERLSEIEEKYKQ